MTNSSKNTIESTQQKMRRWAFHYCSITREDPNELVFNEDGSRHYRWELAAELIKSHIDFSDALTKSGFPP